MTFPSWARERLSFFVIAGLSAITVAAMVIGPAATAPSASAAPAASAPVNATAANSSVTVAQMTQYVYNATNQVRYDKGLDGYARDSRLDKVAMDWALQQWKNGKMSHNPNYSTQIPSGWQRAGENVASGYTYTQVVPAWVNSPSHYANLVHDYTSIGIGFYEADGKRYWVQVFAKYPGTTVPKRPATSTSTPTSTPAPTPTQSTTPPKPSSTPTPAPSTAASYSAEPAAPSGTTVALQSPSFEGSSAGWSGGAGLDGPSTASRGGKYSLKLNGTAGQTVNLAVKSGEAYSATVWVKPATGNISGSLTLSTVGGTTEKATITFTSSGGWMKVSVPLKIAKAGHTGLRIDVKIAGDGRLDSTSLVRVVNASASPSPAASSSAAPTASPSASATPTASPSSTPAPTSSAPAAPAPAPAPASPAPAAPAPAPSSPAPSNGALGLGILGL